MTRSVRTTTVERCAAFDRQIGVLDRGYPGLAGLSDAAFRKVFVPLLAYLPDEPFVVVVTGAIIPPARLIELTALDGKAGFTTMTGEDIARFRPTPDVVLPDTGAYLITDVDTGAETLSVRPDDALPGILAAGRTPLTTEEGLAVVTQHPEWLRDQNCFEMLGSRAGDKRVTGIWLSKGAPRLGWCWAGNPHSWLGMASAARRIG